MLNAEECTVCGGPMAFSLTLTGQPGPRTAVPTCPAGCAVDEPEA